MTAVTVLTPQQSTDYLDHAIDVSDVLRATETVTAVSISAVGLTIGTSPAPTVVSGNTIVFWISGGTSGEVYYLDITLTIDNGAETGTKMIVAKITILD